MSLFSKTYLQMPAGQTEGKRIRPRLGAKAYDVLISARYELIGRFAERVRQECGCPFPSHSMGPDVGAFFGKAEMRDLLDGITLVAQVVGQQWPSKATEWSSFAARAMREEGMAYEVAADGNVRYLVDTAFQESTDAVVAVLSQPRFAGAKKCVEEAVKSLTSVHPNGKAALQSLFEGLEAIFKIVTGDSKSLDAGNVDRLLQPIVSRSHAAGDSIARGAAEQYTQSFKDWVNACHKYRHGHGEPDPVEPPIDLAIGLVGNGLNYARWIAGLVK
jgi:hypothetical protein